MKRNTDYGPYMGTLYLECVVSVLRILPSFFPSVFIFGIGGTLLLFGLQILGVLSGDQVNTSYEGILTPIVIAGAVIIAFLPVAFSVLSLAGMPGGYGLTAREMDARSPTDEEQELLLSAQRRILWEAPKGTIGPTRWLVIDNNEPNAGVIGTTIYVNRGLLESEYLDAVMAHELGHLNHGDGSLILALRRFVPPPLSFISFEGIGCLPMLLMTFGGGLGLWLTTPAWNRHWQKREYEADRFAFECGQATGLIELLRLYQFFDVAVPFGFLRRTHPHNPERIDQLNKYLREENQPPRPTSKKQEIPASRPSPTVPTAQPVTAPVIGTVWLNDDLGDEKEVGYITQQGQVLDIQHRLLGHTNAGGEAITPQGKAGMSWPDFVAGKAEPNPSAALIDSRGRDVGAALVFAPDRVHIRNSAMTFVGLIRFDMFYGLEFELMAGGVAALLLLLDNPERQ